MPLLNLLYYSKRIYQLGPQGVLQTSKHRFKKKLFILRFKKKAFTGAAHHTWPALAKKYKLDFTTFYQQLCTNHFFNSMLADHRFITLLPPDYICSKTLLKKAHQATTTTLLCPLSHAWQTAFFCDIKINNSKSEKPDIKVPWELSRLQHFFILGSAYQQTSNNTYVHAFHTQVNSWIKRNPYLIGVNWLCPMEVALRAINLLWGFHFFKRSRTPIRDDKKKHWQTIICSLYDHTHYLEHNWEWSDKPNNHYLADLLGYFYLTTFFKTLPGFIQKQTWCYNMLLTQFKHQTHPDGTSYEGSTAYHRLVTEIMLHFILLAQAEKFAIPKWLEETFNHMTTFLQNCSDNQGNLIHIGDDDSGKVVTGIEIRSYPSTRPTFAKATAGSIGTSDKYYNAIPFAPMEAPLGPNGGVRTYPNFGLTIIKKNNWHLTYRHPTFNAFQPTGHFHQDLLSITLNIDQKQILVDPGSYTYTGNPILRNQLRSWSNHNTFYPHRIERDQPLEQQDLFQLDRKPNQQAPLIHQDQSSISIQDNHYEFAQYGLIAHRKVTFDEIQKTVTIDDWYTKNKKNSEKMIGCWNLLFHPTITLLDKKNYWIIMHQEELVATLTSTLPFIKEKAYYAPCYGVMQPIQKLTACKKISFSSEQICIKQLCAYGTKC